MIRINHYTVNTNHNSIIYPEEINSKKYSQLNTIIKEAQNKEGIDLEGDTNFRLSIQEDYYIGKMVLKYKTNQIPLLITAGALSKKKQEYVWNEILCIRDMLFPLDDEILIPPLPPYVVDMAAPSLYKKLDVFDWTEDFTKCVGWLLLSRGL